MRERQVFILTIMAVDPTAFCVIPAVMGKPWEATFLMLIALCILSLAHVIVRGGNDDKS